MISSTLIIGITKRRRTVTWFTLNKERRRLFVNGRWRLYQPGSSSLPFTCPFYKYDKFNRMTERCRFKTFANEEKLSKGLLVSFGNSWIPNVESVRKGRSSSLWSGTVRILLSTSYRGYRMFYFRIVESCLVLKGWTGRRTRGFIKEEGRDEFRRKDFGHVYDHDVIVSLRISGPLSR